VIIKAGRSIRIKIFPSWKRIMILRCLLILGYLLVCHHLVFFYFLLFYGVGDWDEFVVISATSLRDVSVQISFECVGAGVFAARKRGRSLW
jgi:hypothetical protein